MVGPGEGHNIREDAEPLRGRQNLQVVIDGKA
jgi:hypothetical protein